MSDLKVWIDKELRLLKYRRKYLHFDRRVSPSKIVNQISEPKFIIRRAFWPFIETSINFPRYKKDSKTDIRKIEIKSRPICYASHFDSEIYSYYNFILGEYYEKRIEEKKLNDKIIAYRKLQKKCNIHFAYEVFEQIKKIENTVALTFDIEKFFDSLNHKILLENWKKILEINYLPDDQYKIYRSLTKFASVKIEDLRKVFDLRDKRVKKAGRICSSKEFREKVRGQRLIHKNLTDRGIPQGSPISGLLSNIYMFDFDISINNLMTELTGFYRRYSDDLIILVPVEKASIVEEYVRNSITTISRLEINPSKTTRTYFKRNLNGEIDATSETGNKASLQYLGFDFDGKNILIRSSSLSRYYRKMNARIRKTIIQAKKSKSHKNIIFKRKLYRLYSHLGKRNFISYSYRASIITSSMSIKKQVSHHWSKLHKKIDSLISK